MLADQSQPFALNPATGELTVEGRLDRENKPQYTFNVSVQDSWKNHTVIFLSMFQTDLIREILLKRFHNSK